MSQEKDYYAFISYKREDEKWAKWLQDKLEHYHFPTNLNGRTDLPKYIRPTFRDVTDLKPGLLADEIHNALSNSEWLIVICSPRSAKSPWVCKEAQTFIDSGQSDHIIPFVIEGYPFSNDAADECYPEALLNLTGSKELLAANINEMGRDAAAIKVVSRMFDLRFDTLWQRFEREKNKKRWMIVGFALLFAAISLFIGGYFVHQNRIIMRQKDILQNDSVVMANHLQRIQNDSVLLIRQNDSIVLQNNLILSQRNNLASTNEILRLTNIQLAKERDNVLHANWKMMENHSRFVASKAEELTRSGNAYLASLLSASVLPRNMAHPDRPLVAEAEHALRDALSHRSIVIQSQSRSVDFSPDGASIVTAGLDSVIRVWDVSTGQCIKSLRGSRTFEIRCVRYSPDGTKVASGDLANEARVWDVETGKCIHVLTGHEGWVWKVAFSPDGHMLASASDDGTVRLWNVMTGKCIRALRGHKGTVWALAFSPNGKMLVSSAADNLTKIWNVETGQCIRMLEGHDNMTAVTWGDDGRSAILPDFICAVAFSPDGGRLATATYQSNKVQLWDIETGGNIKSMSGHKATPVSVAFDHEGKTLATCGHDKTIKIWDAETGANLKTFSGHDDVVWDVCFNYDDDIVVSVGGQTVRIWDVGGDKGYRSIKGSDNFLARYSPDGKYIASASTDEKSNGYHVLKLWNASTGACIQTFSGHDWDIRSVAFSSDGKRLVSASRDETVKLWDVKTGQCTFTFRKHEHNVSNAIFSPDGQKVASSAWDNTLYIWNASDGRVVTTIQENSESMDFSPNGHLLAVSSGDNVVLYDVANGKMVRQFIGHRFTVRNVAFSLDGMTLASASDDNTVKLWNVRTGRCNMTFTGHASAVNGVSFSPSGNYLVSASADGKVIVWNAVTGIVVCTYNDHCDFVNSAFFSPDGRYVMSAAGGTDCSIHIRTFDDMQTLINMGWERLRNHTLSSEERRKYYLE